MPEIATCVPIAIFLSWLVLEFILARRSTRNRRDKAAVQYPEYPMRPVNHFPSRDHTRLTPEIEQREPEVETGRAKRRRHAEELAAQWEQEDEEAVLFDDTGEWE